MQTAEQYPRQRPAKLAAVTAPHEPAQGPELEDQGFSIEDFLRVLKAYKWSILGVALIGAIIGLLNALAAVPVYRAEAKLLVKVYQPNIGNVNQFESAPMQWLFYQTQGDIIRSRAVAEKVVDRLQLMDTPADPVATSSRNNKSGWAASMGDMVSEFKREWLPDWRQWLSSGVRKTQRKPTRDERRQALISSIQGGVQVNGGKESEVLAVAYESSNPIYAAKIANAVAQAYSAFGLESRASNVQEATVWLGGRIEELQSKLSQSEQALRDYKSKEGLVGTENRQTILSSRLASLSDAMVRAASKRSNAEARFRQVQKLLKGKPDYKTLSTLLNNKLVREAYRAKVGIDQRVNELSERYGRKHPKMVSAINEQRDTARQLRLEVDSAVANVRKEYELAAAQEREVKNLNQQQQAELRNVSGKLFELDKLEREVESNRKLYETFLERFKEAQIANNYNVTNVRVIDPAQVPGVPVRPNKQRIAIIAALLGLFIGIALAFMRNHFDRTFKNRDDIERILKLPVLGMLQKLRPGLLRKKLETDRWLIREPQSPFAEAINDIRTAILFSHIDEPPKTILVTSAVPAEGKTVLASNLALSFAQRGKTLLLEGDLRKGRFDGLFGFADVVGITDVVSGQCELQDALVQDRDVESLSILPGGTRPPNPLEIVSSQRFARELEQLLNTFEYIVIDGPPLLLVSDSIVIGDMVDAVILTVQADHINHALSRDAVKRLTTARIQPTGVVLQQVDVSNLQSYSGYKIGYGAYYGYYGGGS